MQTLGMIGVGDNPCPMDMIGFWSTWGLNRADKQREMSVFMHKSKVGMFGLLEKRIKRAKSQRYALTLCDGWSFTTNLTVHSRGMIWMVWKPMMSTVNIVLVTTQLIHSMVKHRGSGKELNISLVYGFNDQALKRSLWGSLTT